MSLKGCDAATEGLIYALLVFTPWFFGTTDPQAMWTASIGCYLLGGILILKWIIRAVKRNIARQKAAEEGGEPLIVLDGDEPAAKSGRWIAPAMAALTALALGYTLVSALNARATYLGGQLFDYHEPISWLPHSYDSNKTWFFFWMALGWACFFWAARDWILTSPPSRSRREEGQDPRPGPAMAMRGRGERERREMPSSTPAIPAGEAADRFPSRLTRLLWVLCINGGLLAIEGILQRLDGTSKLLWIQEPFLNKTALSQFGPYAYRANAAGYFNMVWPVCLGFWVIRRRAELRRRRLNFRIGAGNYLVLLPFAVVMAACPIITTSRGGAFLSVGLMAMAVPIVLIANRQDSWKVRAGILSMFLFILLFAGALGWKQLELRLETLFTDQMSNRVEIYENSKKIAQDFPLFGAGPGTFSSIYQLYREPSQKWHATVHDDWLELRLTFGWLGFSLLLALLALTACRWFFRGKYVAPWDFVALLWVAIFGALVHAKYDFPFQVYSLTLLFLLLCCVSSCLSKQPESRSV